MLRSARNGSGNVQSIDAPLFPSASWTLGYPAGVVTGSLATQPANPATCRVKFCGHSTGIQNSDAGLTLQSLHKLYIQIVEDRSLACGGAHTRRSE